MGRGESAEQRVEVIRSARRRRTVSAFRDGDRTVVRVPAGLPAAEERRWVQQMLRRLADRERRHVPSDDTLAARAERLRQRYLPNAEAPASVRWVANQESRWGSCTVAERTIRVSTRLVGLPGWVLDYVLVHELAHLLVTEHDATFWRLVDRYPAASRARGFLEGYALATVHGASAATLSDAD